MNKGQKTIFAAIIIFALAAVGFVSAVSDVNSVTMCGGQEAVFEFTLHNKVDPLTYDITPQGITGVLSMNRVSLGRDESVNFTFTVPTVGKPLGTYPFTMIADGGPSVSTASAMLTIVNCYDSFLSASPSALTINSCSSGKTTLTLANRGYKQDSYTFTNNGDLGFLYSPSSLTLAGGNSGNSDVTISVPCGTQAGSRQVTVTANGNSKPSTVITVNVVVPTPTPIPQGCSYNNPACPAPQVCQNNKCVMPSGCKFHNPDCPVGYTCDVNANTCREIPKIPAPILTSQVQYDVCRGEAVRYDYTLANPGNATQHYALGVEGMNGTLSASSLDVPGNSAKSFSLNVDTSAIAANTYNFNIVATGTDKTVRMASGLKVENCYASGISLSSTDTEFCPSQIKVRTVTIHNSGSQADVFSLSTKDSGDYNVEFQPSALLIPAGSDKTATMLITAPVNPNNTVSSTNTITVIATSNSVTSATMRLTLKDVNSCPIQFEPSMYLSAVRACVNETARLKFDLYNPSDSDLIFTLSANGVNGKLSRTEVPVRSLQTETFYDEIKTDNLSFGSYPVEILAKSDKAMAHVASMLIVEDCFGSNLTLINITGGQIVPTLSPVPGSTPTAVATATSAATATAATPKPSTDVIRVVGVDGSALSSGLEKTITVVLENDAPYALSSVQVFVSNVTISKSDLVGSIQPGERASVKLTVMTSLDKPFNATIRAVSEEGFGEAVVPFNATASTLSASVVRTVTQSINNGTKENVTTVVRLSNSGKATANYTISVSDFAVKASPANVSIPAGASAEVTLNTELPSDKEYNTTLIATGVEGAHLLPVTMNTKTGGSLTGFFSGSLASAAALALVTVAVVFVLLYLARKQGPNDDESDESEEEKVEADGAESAKKKKKG